MKNKINIIVTFYNPGEFLDNCVASLISQKYDNFHIYFVDDCSSDNSCDKLPTGDNRVTVIKNTIRKTALENIHDTIMNHCEPESIVCLVDGDDWLPNKNVLAYINDVYNQNDCWVSYGQASWTDGNKGCASPYPNKFYFDNIRKSPIHPNGQPAGFFVSHIRTFKSGLYKKIEEQDSSFSCMKDKNGNFYRMAYDVPLMLPLMDMAGFEKVKFVDKILYTYNRGNPISEDRINQQAQWDVHKEVYEKPKFKQIESCK